MLIKSDLESPAVVLQAALSQRPPRPPSKTTISQENMGSELCCVWNRKQKYIFLRSWEKVRLSVQGGFYVPKVWVRGKLHGRFPAPGITSGSLGSPEQKTPSAPKPASDATFRVRRAHQKLASGLTKLGFTGAGGEEGTRRATCELRALGQAAFRYICVPREAPGFKSLTC